MRDVSGWVLATQLVHNDHLCQRLARRFAHRLGFPLSIMFELPTRDSIFAGVRINRYSPEVPDTCEALYLSTNARF